MGARVRSVLQASGALMVGISFLVWEDLMLLEVRREAFILQCVFVRLALLGLDVTPALVEDTALLEAHL